MIRIIVNAVFFMVMSVLIPGIVVEGWIVAIAAGLVLGIINVLVKPVLQVLALPITILTLGFFALVVNALMMLLVARIVPGLSIVGFWTAFLVALLYTVLNGLFRDD